MKGKEKDYVSPAIGLIIMVVVAIISIDMPSFIMPSLYLFFALGAVLFIGGYIGASIRSLNNKWNKENCLWT